MAIRISDSVKPGYERIALGNIQKTQPPGGAGLVGSPILNQAQATILGQQSIATQPSPYVMSPNPTGLRYSLYAGDRGTHPTQWKSQVNGAWIANGTTQAACHDSTGPGDVPYWQLADGSTQNIQCPTSDNMAGCTVALWVKQQTYGGGYGLFGHSQMEVLWNDPNPVINFGTNPGRFTDGTANAIAGVWHHMVFVHGTGFWVNGINRLAGPSWGWGTYGNAYARVGYDGYAAPNLRIASIRMWNRLLNASEIAAEYAQGIG